MSWAEGIRAGSLNCFVGELWNSDSEGEFLEEFPFFPTSLK